METPVFSLIDFPKSRLGTIDLGRIARGKHHIAALLELDVTEARRRLRELRTSSGASFTAWLIRSIGAAVADHREVHGLLHRSGRRLVVFDDIDIATVVEKTVDGTRVPLPLVIRGANRKPVTEIHAEIQSAKHQIVRHAGDYVLATGQSAWPMKLYYFLPGMLRRLALKFILAHPLLLKKTMGTVMVTSVGSVATFPGWFVHKSYHNLSFGIGSVVKKPWVVGEAITIREILNMTILMDHDAVDGAPMARFVEDLSHRVETAAGLTAEAPPSAFSGSGI